MAIHTELTVPADKSISHRALIFSSLAEGTTLVRNFLFAQDCLSTASVLKSLGIKIDLDPSKSTARIEGRGKFGFLPPRGLLDAGNSGTTMRIMTGVLAGQPFDSVITGDESLRKRPMRRVVGPLSLMGAQIRGRTVKRKGKEEILPPLHIKGNSLIAARISSPIASAQVKSAVLLAGLHAEGVTHYKEPIISRDHTERMFRLFGVRLLRRKGWILVNGESELRSPGELFVPGDISSAAFFIGLGLILPNCEIRIKEVGTNPTRTGVLDVFRRMGAKLRLINKIKSPEPYADIVVKSSNLKGVKITSEEIPRLIDEIPIIAVVAAFAKGRTYIEAVDELRVKECDRLEAIRFNLTQMGCEINVIEKRNRTDLEIIPPKSYKSFRRVKAWKDHRIVMAMAVAMVKLGQDFSGIEDKEAVTISYPGFWDALKTVTKGA